MVIIHYIVAIFWQKYKILWLSSVFSKIFLTFFYTFVLHIDIACAIILFTRKESIKIGVRENVCNQKRRNKRRL